MGERGLQLVKNISASGRIAAICDADARKTTVALQENQVDWSVYDDYRRLIEQKDLDAVLICTPHHQHVMPGILACQAGLDVYVEKPLSLYVTEGRALVKAARKYGRIVQTGSQQRSMEMDRFACEFVREGGIGKVKCVEAVNFPGPFRYPEKGLPETPIPPELNWEMWQGSAPTRPFNPRLAMKELEGGWLSWRDYSGGYGADLFAHSYDMIQYALGMDETGPIEFWPVEGKGMTARIDFRYANGIEVHVRFLPWTDPPRGPHLGAIFAGERCKIEINRNKFTTNPRDFIVDPPDPALAKKWEGDGWVAEGHIENWFDCIKSRAKPNADVEIGHRTVTIAHLTNIARELGRKLRWDPEKEQIKGDREANLLLDRPRRAGWELPII
jgi:predicted dehydrogenase